MVSLAVYLPMLLTIVAVRVVECRPAEECGKAGFGIVFDAGSTDTEMYIYSWPENKTAGTGHVKEIAVCEVEGGGIADYVDTPEKAGESLKACLQEATNDIDESDHRFTPVYLGATAGMRLVEKTDPVGSAVIFDFVREVLEASRFNFSNQNRQVRIISGKDEGLFGWVTLNYLANRFIVDQSIWETIVSIVNDTESKPQTTFGALDLGGASTQITFVPEHPDALPEQYRIQKRLYGTSYDIYSHSFLCYGINEASRRLKALLLKYANYTTADVDNPCLHTGNTEVLDGNYLWKSPCSEGPQAMAAWGSKVTPPDDNANITYDTEFKFIGTGNPDECAGFVSKLFDFNAPCEHPPCSFNDAHQPKPHGHFTAFAGFYYVVNSLLQTTTPTFAEFETAKHNYCLKNVTEVMNMADYNKYYLTYCFTLNYVWTLLIDGYGFEESNWDIEFVKKVDDASVGWAMGYMIDATNRIPSGNNCTDGNSAPAMFQLHGLIWSLAFAATVNNIRY